MCLCMLWTAVDAQQSLFSGCPHHFATVLDLATNMSAKICGGSDVTVTSHMYTTHGSRAAVVVHVPLPVSNPTHSPLLDYFVIKCEAVGCADVEWVSSDVWVQRFGARMQLGCVASSLTWQLFCVDSRWHGPANNCTSLGRRLTVVFILVAPPIVARFLSFALSCMKNKSPYRQKSLFARELIQSFELARVRTMLLAWNPCRQMTGSN